jgi:hypothetical protein
MSVRSMQEKLIGLTGQKVHIVLGLEVLGN